MTPQCDATHAASVAHQPGIPALTTTLPYRRQTRSSPPQTLETVSRPPSIDLNEAQRFLEALAPGESFTFQTFSDAPGGSKRLTRVLHGTLDQHADELVALNQQGAGVFVMVNQGDGRGRKESNVIRVRALFVDLDGSPIEPVRSFDPTIVVMSSHGRWHAYWRVEDCSLEEFKSLQRELAAKLGGDAKVCDLPRVMRLPGFLHQKGTPRRTRLETCRPDALVTVNTVREAILGRPTVSAAAGGHRIQCAPAVPALAASPTEVSEVSEDISASSVPSVGARISGLTTIGDVDIPAWCLPRSRGMRHQAIFSFARFLKGHAPDASQPDRQAALRVWYEAVKGVIDTKDFGISLSDFESAWENVKSPAGVAEAAVLDAADHFELPADLSVVLSPYEQTMARLAIICFALARWQEQQHEDAPFILPSRKAAEWLGLKDHSWAASLLRTLVRLGVIAVAQKGTRKRATRYRLTWSTVNSGTSHH